MTSSLPDVTVETVDPHSWVHPNDLEMWQLWVYQERFGGSFTSYEVHYKAAVRSSPSRVSEARMEITASLVAVERLRRAGAALDRDLAKYSAPRGYKVWSPS